MSATIDCPLFVMGAERSGTSTLARFLREELGYSGESEGHVFSLLHKLLVQVASHFTDNGFRIDRVPGDPGNEQVDITTAELVSEKVFEATLCAAWEELVRVQHRGLWFDKTPGPDFIRCAPTLHRMYPNARFIFLIRDPVSSVESSMRKFGSTFEEACDRWRQCAEAWMQSKGALPQACFIELKTHELSSKTDDCLDRIANLLSAHPLTCPPEEVRQKRLIPVERTSTGDLGRTKSPDAVGWTAEQTQMFREKCSALAALYGFQEGHEATRIETGIIHFPPPYGQKNVHIAHGEKGGVWPQLHDGQICIFLHPSVSKDVTSITYHDVEFPSAGELSATAYVLPEAMVPVAYEIEVVGSGADAISIIQSCVCEPGEQKDLKLLIPQACESVTVKISTKSVSDSVMNAWALVSCPVFQADAPSRS